LAWLKDAEQRGDVDWQLVKELHDSFKYSNLGVGAQALTRSTLDEAVQRRLL
jgi:filamentous hemagglutinin